MPVVDTETFVATVASGTRLMGLDPGSKRIGVALSDTTRAIASPAMMVRRVKFRADAAALFELCDAQQVGGIVIGLPVNMDGSEGPRAQSARQFAANLAGARDLPVTLWDERLTTAAVERVLIEADASRARRGEVIDKMAAAWMLQGFLDRYTGWWDHPSRAG